MNEWSFLLLLQSGKDRGEFWWRQSFLCVHSLLQMVFSVGPESTILFNRKICGSGLGRWHLYFWLSVSLASRLPSWASAASPVKWGVGLSCQLWLLSDLARLAAVWHLLFTCVLLFGGFLLISLLLSETRLHLSLSVLLWTSSYICPYDLLLTKGLAPP